MPRHFTRFSASKKMLPSLVGHWRRAKTTRKAQQREGLAAKSTPPPVPRGSYFAHGMPHAKERVYFCRCVAYFQKQLFFSEPHRNANLKGKGRKHIANWLLRALAQDAFSRVRCLRGLVASYSSVDVEKVTNYSQKVTKKQQMTKQRPRTRIRRAKGANIYRAGC